MEGERVTPAIASVPILQIDQNLVNNSPEIATPPEEPKPIRNEKGQLLPGVVLNPDGKPKGSKHFKTLFIEAVKEIGAKNAKGEDISKDKVIVKKIIDQAMAGNLKAADMVIGRVDGDKEDAPLLQVNVIALTKEQQDALQELL